MKTKFTPGPWAKIATGDSLSIAAKAGETSWKDVAIVAMPTGTTKAEKQANARLIAAAPELLAALENLCNLITDEDMPNEIRDAESIARAVIAKARRE